MKPSVLSPVANDPPAGREPQRFAVKAAQWQQQPASDDNKWFLTRWKESAQQSFSAKMPDWALNHSTQITNGGLMVFTSLMIASIFRSKAILGHIYKAQEGLIAAETGLEGEALANKVSELVQNGTMKTPVVHHQRLVYLGTAIASFATGLVFPPKTESAEQIKKYDTMSWPEYIGTRVFQGLDPINHSRQTVGIIGAVSGVLAAKSGLSQPGGALKSEVAIGATLIAGFTSLMMIKDPDKAKEAFSTCWWARLPFVLTGTYETLMTYPAFKHPLTEAPLKLPFRRMDIAYPIGQWGNLGFAAFGLLTAGAAAKRALESSPPIEPEKPDSKIQQPQHEQIIKPAPRGHEVPVS